MPTYPNKKTLSVKIDKLVHGGQGIGTLDDGRKAFVWNALPDEKIEFDVTKNRKDYVEGIATNVLIASEYRVKPKDDIYLSTSPWQILDENKEDDYKKQILSETFEREKVAYSDIEFRKTTKFWNYRNKMEYSFFGDESGLHLALYNRGTHRKQIVNGSSIAMNEIDNAANKICQILDKHKVRASDLKSLVIRCNQKGESAAALYVKDNNFLHIKELEQVCKGLVVVFSNPKSPASVRTKDLFSYGDIKLSDRLLDNDITYDVFSFFQVNLDIFEAALSKIKVFVADMPVVDMYSGVGTIGLCLKNTTKLVEVDEANIKMAEYNIKNETTKLIHAASEKAVAEIDSTMALVVDPPRAGLHKDLITEILNKKPPLIAYLSCNPSTQSRDVKHLLENYKITKIIGYNFFPRTPHIESLVLLVRK